MVILRNTAAHLDRARGCLERCSDDNPADAVVLARALTVQILAEALDQYILATGDNPMPSERPQLPRDTYARALAGPGANRNLPLQAGEVATFKRSRRAVLTDRVMFTLLFVLVGAFGLALGVLL
jgi:hypothetical protein